ncbi:MAG TPA: non-ribosomal peptide synthetase [Pseudonocardiaceae bacterium]|nr:non-ribosomal peptide synthetase [Pseudonocardiaceae bacterium]
MTGRGGVVHVAKLATDRYVDFPLGTVDTLAAGLAVAPEAVLLAAHLKVAATMTGEDGVLTAVLRDGRLLTAEAFVGPGSWRELIETAARAEHRAARDTAPRFVLDLDNALLRCRVDQFDDAAASRFAGYHRTALDLIAADTDADHRAVGLLSPAEWDLQINGMAGAARALPDESISELFERQVRARPDAVAAECGGERWTYARLNRRANQLANALLATGLVREDVVAVVTERGLDWLASVLAIFKAGGAYLPIDPTYPAQRVATMLSRSGCRHVLTTRASAGSLPCDDLLFIEDAYRAGHPDTDPGLRTEPGQLAYIYFTSGSTGAPKGAMCEHAGMINHLFAKIDDLGIDKETAVAQTAPQCFDISLWQLVSALLVGGRTVIVGQDDILDLQRFLDVVDEAGVNVLQLVPSYLDVLLGHLAHRPRALPRLRRVSATGEALKKGLVERWFALRPDVALVNAYGLTETSDDTNHEVMTGVPDSDQVPLGRPVSNVTIYVLDEQLAPVPLGAPGEIVFSGVCVGRGYVNDPERTEAAFRPDPHRPGLRIYRSGDFGRWRPDGRLEFLGRRDAQVKVRGFRIEIGEIENQLLRVPGVRDAAVVVDADEQRPPSLVAFYSAAEELASDVLRESLGAALPEYMVPASFHHRASLPLTDNGKIDKKVLTRLAGELAVTTTGYAPPKTSTERLLADAWAGVLDVPSARISRTANFFELGGTSLAAVRLMIALRRQVSLADLTRAPVLASLASFMDSTLGQERV